ncbi:MAG: hypothetical protein IJD35_06820 [Clostridia bacterium]|nr:hypothetical protein [Clostridia bacterium]
MQPQTEDKRDFVFCEITFRAVKNFDTSSVFACGKSTFPHWGRLLHTPLSEQSNEFFTIFKQNMRAKLYLIK